MPDNAAQATVANGQILPVVTYAPVIGTRQIPPGVNPTVSIPQNPVTAYGAVADAVILNVAQGLGAYISVAAASATATLSTLVGANYTGFVQADVGKAIMIPGAGTASAALSTTITAVASDGLSCTLAAAAVTAVTNGIGYYGTNNVVAFQTATALGGNTLVPSGNYMIASGATNVLTLVAGARITGIGNANIILAATGARHLFAYVGSDAEPNIKVSGLTVYMSGSGGAFRLATGITTASRPSYTVEDCTVIGAPTVNGGVFGSGFLMAGVNSKNAVVRNSFFYGLAAGVNAGGGPRVLVSGCTTDTCNTGFIAANDQATIIDNTAINSANIGINVTGNFARINDNFVNGVSALNAVVTTYGIRAFGSFGVMESNIVDGMVGGTGGGGSTGASFFIGNFGTGADTDWAFSGNVTQNCTISQAFVFYAQRVVATGNKSHLVASDTPVQIRNDGIVFTGNIVYANGGCAEHAVMSRFDNGLLDSVTFVGNTIVGVANGGPGGFPYGNCNLFMYNCTRCKVADNQMSDGGYGIYMQNGSGNLVENNHITSTRASAGTGIYIDTAGSASNNNYVRNNKITGFATTITNGGTGNKIVGPMCILAGTVTGQANNTVISVGFSTELSDDDNLHDTVTNNDRITIKTAGLYRVTAQAKWADGGATTGRIVDAYKNGATLGGGRNTADTAGRGGITTVAYSTCVPGDYFSCILYQLSGGPLDVNYVCLAVEAI